MSIKCILLDLDGVCVDFVGAALALYGIKSSPSNPSWNLVKDWDGIPRAIYEAKGKEVSHDDLWRKIAAHGSDFWANLEWYPFGQELFNICAEFAPVALMSTPTSEPSCAAGKVQWINENMPKEWQRRYFLTPCKHHVAHPGALLIDDSTSNCKKFREHGGQVYLWPMPWNMDGRGSEYSTTKRLKDFKAFLERLENRTNNG